MRTWICPGSEFAISGPAFSQAVVRYLKLKAFGTQSLDFTSIPPVCFNALALYADTISVYKIARMPPARRTAMLVAFVRYCEISGIRSKQTDFR